MKADRQERYNHNLGQLTEILQEYIGQAGRLDQMQEASYDFSKSIGPYPAFSACR